MPGKQSKNYVPKSRGQSIVKGAILGAIRGEDNQDIQYNALTNSISGKKPSFWAKLTGAEDQLPQLQGQLALEKARSAIDFDYKKKYEDIVHQHALDSMTAKTGQEKIMADYNLKNEITKLDKQYGQAKDILSQQGTQAKELNNQTSANSVLAGKGLLPSAAQAYSDATNPYAAQIGDTGANTEIAQNKALTSKANTEAQQQGLQQQALNDYGDEYTGGQVAGWQKQGLENMSTRLRNSTPTVHPTVGQGLVTFPNPNTGKVGISTYTTPNPLLGNQMTKGVAISPYITPTTNAPKMGLSPNPTTTTVDQPIGFGDDSTFNNVRNPGPFGNLKDVMPDNGGLFEDPQERLDSLQERLNRMKQEQDQF